MPFKHYASLNEYWKKTKKEAYVPIIDEKAFTCARDAQPCYIEAKKKVDEAIKARRPNYKELSFLSLYGVDKFHITFDASIIAIIRYQTDNKIETNEEAHSQLYDRFIRTSDEYYRLSSVESKAYENLSRIESMLRTMFIDGALYTS